MTGLAQPLVIAGGGLAGCLAAIELVRMAPIACAREYLQVRKLPSRDLDDLQ